MLDSLGLFAGNKSISAPKLRDKKRLYDAAKKVSTTYKIRRQALRGLKKAKADKDSYSTSSFCLSKIRGLLMKERITKQ